MRPSRPHLGLDWGRLIRSVGALPPFLIQAFGAGLASSGVVTEGGPEV